MLRLEIAQQILFYDFIEVTRTFFQIWEFNFTHYLLFFSHQTMKKLNVCVSSPLLKFESKYRMKWNSYLSTSKSSETRKLRYNKMKKNPKKKIWHDAMRWWNDFFFILAVIMFHLYPPFNFLWIFFSFSMRMTLTKWNNILFISSFFFVLNSLHSFADEFQVDWLLMNTHFFHRKMTTKKGNVRKVFKLTSHRKILNNIKWELENW